MYLPLLGNSMKPHVDSCSHCASTAGVLVQLSDRPLLCSASLGDGSNDVVVGSSDHALYVVDTTAGRKKRTLYSKSTGHAE